MSAAKWRQLALSKSCSVLAGTLFGCKPGLVKRDALKSLTQRRKLLPAFHDLLKYVENTVSKNKKTKMISKGTFNSQRALDLIPASIITKYNQESPNK